MDLDAALVTTDLEEQNVLEVVAESREAAVPVHTGMQRHGDVLVIPDDLVGRKPDSLSPVEVTTEETAVHGHGNLHTVAAVRGRAIWYPARPGSGQDIGVLDVLRGGVVFVRHRGSTAHHGPLAVGRGRYVLRAARTHIFGGLWRINGGD